MVDQFKVKRGSSAAWSSANPTLAIGELGYDTTKDGMKLGTGASAWAQLPWLHDPDAVHYDGDAPSAQQIADLLNTLGVPPEATTMTTTGGLTGGGDLSANRTFRIDQVPTWTVGITYTAGQLVQSPSGAFGASTVSLMQCITGHAAAAPFDTSKWKQLADIGGGSSSGGVPTTRNVATNGGITGGGDLSTDRTHALAQIPSWVASASFTAGQLVLSPSGAYTTGTVSLMQCTTTHTAGTTFAGTNWKQLADLTGSVAGGGTFAALGWTLSGMTATTQAAATANSNAIANANSAALQSAFDNVPPQTPIYIPPVDANSNLAYYLGTQIKTAKDGIKVFGGVGSSRSSAGTSVTGGSTLKDVPGFSGQAMIVLDGCTGFTMKDITMAATTAKTCILDNGVNGDYLDCTWVGGTEAAFDTRNAVQAPYNMVMTINSPNGQSGRRNNLTGCNASGRNSNAGTVCIYFGLDHVIVGGRYTTGTKIFNGSGIVCAGVHFTGGIPNIQIDDIRNTITGCQIDGGGGSVALIKVNAGPCMFISNLLYQSSGAVNCPCFLITSTNGPKVDGAYFSSDSGDGPYTSLTAYSGGGNPATTSMMNIYGATLGSSGNVQTLWDASGPPQSYSVTVGNGVLMTSNQQRMSGTTASRPAAANIEIGQAYLDTTLHKPVWWDGTNWRDATGTIA